MDIVPGNTESGNLSLTELHSPFARAVQFPVRLAMFRNVTPEKAIAFTQLVVALSFCWPLPPSVTKHQVLRFKIARTVALLNSIVLFFPLLYAIHVYRDDAENLCKAACFLFAMIQIVFQTAFYTIQYKRLQRLTQEMIVYCEGARSYERRVFQKYVNKFSTFYGISAIWFYLTAFFMCLGTVFISDPFPTNAMYPLFVNFQPVKSIIFVHQAFAGLQVAAHACISVFGALLLLFATARFEILAIELRSVNNIDSLIKCIRKYHALKRYANEIANSFRFVAVYIVTVSGIGAVVCGINIIGRQPFTVKIQFLFVAGTALLEVFMCAWPADCLMDASEKVMQEGYYSLWYELPLKMQKSVQLMITPRLPVLVGVSCIIPMFSLNYYCSFISSVFSLFTALRIVLLKDENES